MPLRTYCGQKHETQWVHLCASIQIDYIRSVNENTRKQDENAILYLLNGITYFLRTKTLRHCQHTFVHPFNETRHFWGKDTSRHRQHSFLNVSQGITYLLQEKTPVDIRNTWLCINHISRTFFQRKYQEKPSAHQSASIGWNPIPTGWKHKKHFEQNFLGPSNEMTDHHLRAKTRGDTINTLICIWPTKSRAHCGRNDGQQIIFKGIPRNDLLPLGKKHREIPLTYRSASNLWVHVQSVGEKHEETAWAYNFASIWRHYVPSCGKHDETPLAHDSASIRRCYVRTVSDITSRRCQ